MGALVLFLKRSLRSAKNLPKLTTCNEGLTAKEVAVVRCDRPELTNLPSSENSTLSRRSACKVSAVLKSCAADEFSGL
jgi:hypothetical protein